jgi:hypothetical protein
LAHWKIIYLLRKLPRYYGISISENYGCPCPVLKFIFSIHYKVMLSQWITPKVLEIKWKHEASQLLTGRKKHAFLTPISILRKCPTFQKKGRSFPHCHPACFLSGWTLPHSCLFGLESNWANCLWKHPKVFFFVQ